MTLDQLKREITDNLSEYLGYEAEGDKEIVRNDVEYVLDTLHARGLLKLKEEKDG